MVSDNTYPECALQWQIQRVKNRHGIVHKNAAGEVGSLEVSWEEWLMRLPDMLHCYMEADIYNGDETALFFPT